jgi:uncharacterized protein YprB with RNaseH-like and TPR domain
MNLRQQLARLSGAGLQSKPATPPVLRPVPTEAGITVTEHLTEHGPVHWRQTTLAEDHAHGAVAILPAASATAEHLRLLALDEVFRDCPPAPLLFLDTETTGLAGGTGTLPFLVGLARFTGRSLELQQLFLHKPAQERALLIHLREQLESSAVWVTFNGKSFDWPLLRTRYVMNRLTPPTPKPHLDLLYASRRTFRPRTSSTRLVELESEILSFHRQGDIPGSEIPERYFRFLRQGRMEEEIAPILEHNLWDLVALAGLLAYLSQGLDGKLAHPWDAAMLGAIALRAGDELRARDLASHATACAQTAPDAAGTGWEVIAALERRAGKLESAAHSLEQAVSHWGASRRPRVHLELAKLFEHRLRDLPKARAHAAHGAPAETVQAHVKRVERLERKFERATRLANLQKRLV